MGSKGLKLSSHGFPGNGREWESQQPESVGFHIPSLKLTWHLKMAPCKRRFLLETIIFRGELLVSGSVTGGKLWKTKVLHLEVHSTCGSM